MRLLAAESTTTTSTALWFTLIAALGGVLITGLFALATAILNHRWQHEATQRTADEERRKQFRQERREVYSEYLRALNTYNRKLDILDLEVARRKAANAPVAQTDPELANIINTEDDAWRKAAANVQMLASLPVVQNLSLMNGLIVKWARQAWVGELGQGRDLEEMNSIYSQLLFAMREDLSPAE